jgi:hypothetical protein
LSFVVFVRSWCYWMLYPVEHILKKDWIGMSSHE